MARKLDEERVRLQQEISTRLEEEHARQVAEKDKRLSDAMKANDELRRKLQQGSQQLQGEVLELALEDLISQTFPSDLVQPVPKGINGADIIQRVQNPNGDLAGSIIWESKRTKAWSDGWIQKIKDDQRQAKADIAILVSDALPKDCNHFKQLGGIWVIRRIASTYPPRIVAYRPVSLPRSPDTRQREPPKCWWNGGGATRRK